MRKQFPSELRLQPAQFEFKTAQKPSIRIHGKISADSVQSVCFEMSGGFKMNSSSRLVTALLLATSLLAGSVATFAQDKSEKSNTPAQTQAPRSEERRVGQ